MARNSKTAAKRPVRKTARPKAAPKPKAKPVAKPKATPKAAEQARKPKRGRPSLYDPKTTPVIARGLAKGAATDIEIADALGIATSVLYSWQARHPEFAEALKVGKAPADDRVVRSLYRRAMGYTFDAEKIQVLSNGEVVRVPYREIVAPCTTACIFWLKNRDRANWRDKLDHEHAGAISIEANFGPPDDG